MNQKILKEQQPNRYPKWNFAVFVLWLLSVLSFITIVGSLFTPIFFIPLLIVVWIRRSRYPIIKARCPECGFKAKIETQVTEFTCIRCYSRLVKEEDNWKLDPVDPKKLPFDIKGEFL